MSKFQGHIIVKDWMFNELPLSLVETVIFALIYGFRTSGLPFNGSLPYICSVAKCTPPTAIKALKALCDLGYLNKREYRDTNNNSRCEYTINAAAIAEYITIEDTTTTTKPSRKKPASAEDEAAARRMITLYEQGGFPAVECLTDSCLKAIVKTVNQLGEETVAKALRKAASLPKLHGGIDNWQPGIDWFLAGKSSADNLAKVLNGAYDGQVKRPACANANAGTSAGHNYGQRQLDDDEIAAIHRMMAEADEEVEAW